MSDWKIRPEYLEKSSEERYVCAAKELDNVVLNVIKKNKYLEELISDKDSRILELQETIDSLNKQIVSNRDFLTSITPVQVYQMKQRRSTTVKFLDGSQVTVHRMKGDKNCLETAIVYAVFKKIYPKRLLENLVNTTVKVKMGGKKCKKKNSKN